MSRTKVLSNNLKLLICAFSISHSHPLRKKTNAKELTKKTLAQKIQSKSQQYVETVIREKKVCGGKEL